jgi:tRNA A-37 threonylcarbamoyl transferase component Bud32
MEIMGIGMPKRSWRCLLFLCIFSICLVLPDVVGALEFGSIAITSRPAGAAVYLDDTPIGETNIVINAVPEGSHKIRVELAGYERVEQIIAVPSGRTIHIPLALARTKGRIAFPSDMRIPPLEGLFAEFTNPWVIVLAVLLFAVVVILTLIMRALPARGKVAARTAPKRKRVPVAARGSALKKAAVFGNYRIVERIASGGMATIYKATHIKSGELAVLKVPYDQFQNDHKFVERFRREASLGQRLRHDNIIRVYESGRAQDNRIYIAMEYLPGIDLRGYLDAYGKMPVKEAVRIMVQVCRALGYAHARGVIHRDIKPENIMLLDKRGRGKAVLMDFGVAHAAYLGTVGTRSSYLGTPYYMSPDQISRRQVSGRSDIYSLGVVFFEVLTGKRPFGDADPLKVLIKHRESPPPKPRSLNSRIPAGLERVIMKMLAKRPAERYKSADALAAALKRYL